MNKIAKFSKVSYEQFEKDFWSCADDIMRCSPELQRTDPISFVKEAYENIRLPIRATSCSAGYDFFCPFPVYLHDDMPVKLPLGIRCEIEDGYVLLALPKSGLGFTYGMNLANTCGVIDSDYYHAKNEGHIQIKFSKHSKEAMNIVAGSKIAQGIFVPFGITVDDEAYGIRTGGFGSTGK